MFDHGTDYLLLPATIVHKYRPAIKTCFALGTLPTDAHSCVQHERRFKAGVVEVVTAAGAVNHLLDVVRLVTNEAGCGLVI